MNDISSWISAVRALLCRTTTPGLVAAATLAAVAPASAEKQNIVAVTCVPSPESIPLMTTSQMHVRFRPDQSGTIRLRCPVSNPDNYWDWFRIWSTDGDGMGTLERVRVHLKRADQAGGVMGTICTLDSNTSDSVNLQTKCDIKSHNFEPHKYWYWFEVVLDKAPGGSGPINTPAFGGIFSH